jgi:MYXO-CTERM domain-containing protein
LPGSPRTTHAVWVLLGVCLLAWARRRKYAA